MLDTSPTMLIKANTVSNNVFFILSGQIHIMSKDGQYKYCTLSEGSYFGEISLLLDEPNEYSYYFNPNDKSVNLLAINGLSFLKVCENHLLSKELLIKHAKQRK